MDLGIFVGLLSEVWDFFAYTSEFGNWGYTLSK